SGSSGSGQQSLNVKLNMDFWSDLKNNLQILIGTKGNFNVSTSTSSVTVRTTPSNMVQVENYIKNVNQELERQVTVNVAVYSVEVTDTSNLALSLSGILRRAGNTLGMLDGSSLSVGSLPTLTAYINGDGDNNNAALISALDKAGKVSIVTSASVTTMSGQPTPLQVGGNRTYVSQIGTTMNNNTTQNSVSTSSVTSGFSMNILPRVMDDGHVLLQYGINISSLVGAHNGFDEVTASGTTIQLPNIQQRSFVQSSLLQNGNTLVLAG
ncbi:type II secretion system protein GspD, partial [Escherichia coli]|uniref:type II secretion system protein GspD n=1 Tax=Escherichia coli TaxID=562 RepID=UPI000B1C3155